MRDQHGRSGSELQETEAWRSSLLQLADEVFFDLVRTYIGPLKTPYNKQALLNALENYLRRSEVREQLLSAISDSDRELLTAIALSPGSSHEGVHRLLGSRIGFVRLHHALLNLEDRLLVYRDAGSGNYRLNPLLASELRLSAIDPSLLFPSVEPADPAPEAPVWSDDLMLLAVFSRVRSDGRLLRSDRNLRKTALKPLLELFPTLSREPEFGLRVALLLQSLIGCGLCSEHNGNIVPSYAGFRRLAALSYQARACLVPLLSAAHDDTVHELQQFIDGSLLQTCVDVLTALSPERGYPASSIHGLLALALHPQPGSGKAALPPPSLALLSERIVRSLVQFGILCDLGEGVLRINPRFRRAAEQAPALEGRSALTLQSNYELRLSADTPFARAVELAAASELSALDSTLTLVLSRPALGRALADGISPHQLMATLESLAGVPVPQNVAFSLRNWSEEFEGTSLDEGVVLSADESRRHLIEHDPRMQSYIRKRLAPGVYLLRKSEEHAWRPTLAACGVSMLPSPSSAAGDRSATTQCMEAIVAPFEGGIQPEEHQQRLSQVLALDTRTPPRAADRAESRRAYAKLKERLLAHLEQEQFPSDVTAELRDRVENRVILTPEQLRADTLRRDQTEAKGLDYAGKVRMAEQALSSKRELLEVIERNGAGSPTRRLLKPTALKRTGNRLHLHGVQLPSEREVRIDIAKIGLLRRVRGAAAGS